MGDNNKVDDIGEKQKLPTGNNEVALDLKESLSSVPVPQIETKEMTIEVKAEDFSGTLNNTQVRFMLYAFRLVRCQSREIGHGHRLPGYSPFHLERTHGLLDSR